MTSREHAGRHMIKNLMRAMATVALALASVAVPASASSSPSAV